jgi:hypothetical protein
MRRMYMFFLLGFHSSFANFPLGWVLPIITSESAIYFYHEKNGI